MSDNYNDGTDRLTLYALAAHAAGDFPLQSDWMAANKIDSRSPDPTTFAISTD